MNRSPNVALMTRSVRMPPAPLRGHDVCRPSGLVRLGALLALVAAVLVEGRDAAGQVASIRYGAKVPQDVRAIYDRGLNYLVQTQDPDGNWSSGYGQGITGICLLAFLAAGEDPNFGQYSLVVRRAIRGIISSQDPSTGYLPPSMYCHGFGMLALAEAYGVVDESQLWTGENPRTRQRSIGQALELAVRAAVTAQKNNSAGGWRYSPQDNNADTSVSGAVLVGLLAARNAGVEVPDDCIDRALDYYRGSTSENGFVAYSGGLGGMGESMNRSSIATLVFAAGKRKQWSEYEATLRYISGNLEHQEMGYPFYFRYYMSQALFQGDFEAWTKWKQENIRFLQQTQAPDGSFSGGQGGPAYSTAMALLSLALDYRFLPIYER